ncbi:MAG: L-threonylcarbamoyladenylate synthase [Bdellovibrionota bacterium]
MTCNDGTVFNLIFLTVEVCYVLAMDLMGLIYAPTNESLEQAARLLRDGEVVGIPTETVYGLAADAFNVGALTKVFSVKERPTFDPLIVHVTASGAAPVDLALLDHLQLIDLRLFSDTAKKRADALIHEFWPGPLTLVLPKSPKVPDLATAGLPTVAIRMPRHEVTRVLIEKARVPLAAPSANRFGRISPTTAQDVVTELGDRIPMVIDGGPCEIGLESTVLLINPDGALFLLRPGAISREELERSSGAEILIGPGNAENTPQQAPGLLSSHYAPTKMLNLLPSSLRDLSNEERRRFVERCKSVSTVGFLSFSEGIQTQALLKESLPSCEVILESLPLSSSPKEAAQYFFSKLRSLDRSKAEILFSEPCATNTALGYAIFDRLRRASVPRTS